MKTISDLEKEFDEKFLRQGDETIYRFYRLDFPEGDNRSIKSFISQSLRELLEQVVPEVADYEDENFKLCRQQVEEKIKGILK